MFATKAIVDNSVLVNSNSAVHAWYKIFMAILAESFFKGRRQFNLVLHSHSSGHFYVFIRKVRSFFEGFFS